MAPMLFVVFFFVRWYCTLLAKQCFGVSIVKIQRRHHWFASVSNNLERYDWLMHFTTVNSDEIRLKIILYKKNPIESLNLSTYNENHPLRFRWFPAWSLTAEICRKLILNRSTYSFDTLKLHDTTHLTRTFWRFVSLPSPFSTVSNTLVYSEKFKHFSLKDILACHTQTIPMAMHIETINSQKWATWFPFNCARSLIHSWFMHRSHDCHWQSVCQCI